MNISELAELFDEFYLVDNPLPAAKVKEKSGEIRFEGGNKNHILLLLRKALVKGGAEEQMMDKILGALGISKEDIALLSLEENPGISWEEIRAKFSPEKVVAWDCAEFLGNNRIPLKLHEVQSGATMKLLTVGSPADYLTDLANKRMLWESMQQLLPRS
jgi:hypothetical protein